MSRLKHIFKGLDRAYKKALPLQQDVDTTKLVIFSDHHRGIRDGADDFLACEPMYMKALEYYYEKGYTLLMLGDVEEFWENRFRSVLTNYRNVMDLEKRFFDDGRLYRIWGNHDDHWRFQGAVSKHLGWLFPDLQAFEAIKIKIMENSQEIGELFFVHGHQGTLASERWAMVSKFFVRHVWRNYQRIFKQPLSTPSKSIKLRSEHDHAMYDWASPKPGVILITGHSHQPVFMSLTHADIVLYEIEKLNTRQAQNPEVDFTRELAQLHKKLQEIQKEKKGTHLSSDPKRSIPCYFNSGCCSFADGDITGLEIESGLIKLVKWTPNNDKEYLVLESANLSRIMKKCC